MAMMPRKPIVKITGKLRSKFGTPVLPLASQYADPTRQLGNRKKAMSELGRRINVIKKQVAELIRSIPVEKIQTSNNMRWAANAARYEYLVDTDTLDRIYRRIDMILRQNFVNGKQSYDIGDYWLDDHIRFAYYTAAENVAQAARNVTPAAVAGPVLAGTVRAIGEQPLTFDQGRIRRASLIGSRVFEEMKGLTDQTRANLASVLVNGITQGKGVTELVKEINERIDVAKSRATRIVRTEINSAYRTSTRQETNILNSEVYGGSDFELRMLWFSALASTTRKTHADRHGHTYTVEEVDRFYSRDANAINCYCSQTTVLVNKKTGEIVQQDLLNQMDDQRKKFFDKVE